MRERRYTVFALFSDDIQKYDFTNDTQLRDLQREIQLLNALGLGKLWPLSGKKPSLGFLIYGVKEQSLDEALSILNKQNSVKFAGALPRRIDPSEPYFFCGLRKIR